MRIVKYVLFNNITVEFQDSYKAQVHTNLYCFKNGQVKNPYHPSICGVGVVGEKYATSYEGKQTKEYGVWYEIIKRCFDDNYKEKHPEYISATCCQDWLYYPNFYEWLHSQENFDKWQDGNSNWCIDKDILIKGNKHYSPETCCLVPLHVNVLFTKRDKKRGKYLIGVSKSRTRFQARCNNPFTKKLEHVGVYDTEIEAFFAYKNKKEFFIKEVATNEYQQKTITKQCYEAMMKYEVEITD